MTQDEMERMRLMRLQGFSFEAIARAFPYGREKVRRLLTVGYAEQAAEHKGMPIKARSLAQEMGIEKVSRRVVNRSSIASSGTGSDFGHIFVSLPRVSFIDGDKV